VTCAHLGLSTPPTMASLARRPHQTIPHNVIQSLRGDGRSLLSKLVVGCLLLVSDVVRRWADSRWWLPLGLAWRTCWVIKWCRRRGGCCASSPGHCGHFRTSNKIRIIANELRMFKKPNLTSLVLYPYRCTDWSEIWHGGGNLLRAKFHPHRCNVSPLRGEKPQNRPLSKLNTGTLCTGAVRNAASNQLKCPK